MLVFVDQPKNIKVTKVEAKSGGGTTKNRLGLIAKTNLQVADDLKTALKEDELKEVEEVITIYKNAEEAQERANILQFPQIARQVADYLTSGQGNETERRVLVSAIVDTVRRIRKMDAASSGEPAEA